MTVSTSKGRPGLASRRGLRRYALVAAVAVCAVLVAASFVRSELRRGTATRTTPATDTAQLLATETILELLDTTLLAEADSMPLGKVDALAIEPRSGDYLVADALNDRILRYDTRGKLLGRYGARGRSEDRIVNAGGVFVSDSEVVAVDVGANRMIRYGLATGGYHGSVDVAGVIGSAVPIDGGALLGVLNPTAQTSVAMWRRSAPTLLSYSVPLPEPYRTIEPLWAIYNRVQIATWRDTIAVGLQGLSRIVVVDTAWRLLGAIDVPERVRRGSAEPLSRRFAKREFWELYSLNSYLFGLQRLRMGGLVLIYYDQDVQDQVVTARVYVTLLGPTGQSCIDHELLVPEHAAPAIMFRGDTLYALSQQIDGPAPRAVLRRYAVHADRCR